MLVLVPCNADAAPPPTCREHEKLRRLRRLVNYADGEEVGHADHVQREGYTNSRT